MYKKEIVGDVAKLITDLRYERHNPVSKVVAWEFNFKPANVKWIDFFIVSNKKS